MLKLGKILMLTLAGWSLAARSVKALLLPALALTIALAEPAGDPPLAKEPLAQPNGRVLLTITGAIELTNAPGKAEFDRDMLRRLGTSKLRTSTSWTDGATLFEGVPASDVLHAVGAHGTVATATALNDYIIEIPVTDFERYGVLFALSMNGVELTARNRGPIWVVYPRDDFPELRNPTADAKWIWQLVKIDIK